MKVLVLGGTRFVGRGIVEATLNAKHDVTLFNRGTDRALFPAVPRIIGDRTKDTATLAAQDWDCVVDVSGYRPSEVRPVARAVHDHTQHYVYISTVSVYETPMPPGAGEEAPLMRVDEPIPDTDPRSYGGLKALCESALRASLGDRLTVLRPTVVVGPHDYTDPVDIEDPDAPQGVRPLGVDPGFPHEIVIAPAGLRSQFVGGGVRGCPQLQVRSGVSGQGDGGGTRHVEIRMIHERRHELVESTRGPGGG